LIERIDRARKARQDAHHQDELDRLANDARLQALKQDVIDLRKFIEHLKGEIATCEGFITSQDCNTFQGIMAIQQAKEAGTELQAGLRKANRKLIEAQREVAKREGWVLSLAGRQNADKISAMSNK
jgi:hypothetical protein